MKPPLKFLHTADLHLGAKFVKLGGKGVKQRKRLCQVFLDIVDLAIQEKVDVVLLAGDTFDNQHPSSDSLTAFRIARNRNTGRIRSVRSICLIMASGKTT